MSTWVYAFMCTGIRVHGVLLARTCLYAWPVWLWPVWLWLIDDHTDYKLSYGLCSCGPMHLWPCVGMALYRYGPVWRYVLMALHI